MKTRPRRRRINIKKSMLPGWYFNTPFIIRKNTNWTRRRSRATSKPSKLKRLPRKHLGRIRSQRMMIQMASKRNKFRRSPLEGRQKLSILIVTLIGIPRNLRNNKPRKPSLVRKVKTENDKSHI